MVLKSGVEMEKRKIIINLIEHFISSDIDNNTSSCWSDLTTIESIITDGDYYIVKLVKDGLDNGYIVIGKDHLVKEFAYKREPIIPIKSVNSYDEKRDMPYGGITDTYKHVNDKYGSGWTYHSGKTIDGFVPLIMADFDSVNHCSLTTITAIFNYYQSIGFDRINKDINELFLLISDIATKKGYYNYKTGTYPWYIDNLVRDVLTYYNYSGSANNDFFFWDVKSLNRTLKKEIDEGRPAIISLTNGKYGMHTVTFYGYKIYKKEGFENKMYLKVNDNWIVEPRYIDTTFIGDMGETFFEICRVVLT